MTDPQVFDTRARTRFDTFVFSAVATVLLVRAFLATTGYPQVGGGGLHVAHVLWGGLLMGAAIVYVEVVPGSRTRRRAAFVGGVGFGLFVDEVGKFLTKDVNYFFRPAVAIIYAVFVGGYLIGRWFLSRRTLSDRRRLAFAATALADEALGQLDAASRDAALAMLRGVDETSGLRAAAAAVRAGLLAETPSPPGLERGLSAWQAAVERAVDRVLRSRTGRRLLPVLFVLAIAGVGVNLGIALAYRHGASWLVTAFDTLLPSAASVGLTAAGLARLSRAGIARLPGAAGGALRLLRAGIFTDMLLPQVVVFYRSQWFGLAGFFLQLIVLWLIDRGLDAQRRRVAHNQRSP